MAGIRTEVTIEAPADVVWNAVRDVGQVHKRLGPDAPYGLQGTPPSASTPCRPIARAQVAASTRP